MTFFNISSSANNSNDEQIESFGVDLTDGGLYSLLLVVVHGRVAVVVDGMQVGAWREHGLDLAAVSDACSDTAACELTVGGLPSTQKAEWQHSFEGVMLLARLIYHQM